MTDAATMGLDQFLPHIFVPLYRPMRSGKWELRQTGHVLCPGYWGPPQLVTGLTALLRDGVTWMSITPLEVESQQIGIEASVGHVVIFGLGMGWAAAAAALRPEVRAVTVVERDRDVITLHRDLDIFSQLPADARGKIRIEEGDAFHWRPQLPVDLLMPDIWLPLMSDGRVDEVRQMQANVNAQAIYFWGQELEIARHCIAAGRTINDEGIRATIVEFNLPLLGPETPGYAERVGRASAHWMKCSPIEEHRLIP
jgi:hypothetical protein